MCGNFCAPIVASSSNERVSKREPRKTDHRFQSIYISYFSKPDKLREHILKIHAINGKCDSTKTASTKSSSQSSSEIAKSSETLDLEDLTPNAIDQNSKPHKESHAGAKAIDASKKAKFEPKVAPSDYQRFIYKCNDCMLGFKRRGMLVNHMAKQHPNISIDSVPELNLPILQTQRCYYCTYCDKVYKSSSKRKAHILKYHPGRELPQSTRQKSTGDDHAVGVLHDPSFSESISSITTHAHQCRWCYKQYASKTRLLQHQRKQHNEEIHSDLDATRNNDFYEASTHHHMQDNRFFDLNEQDHPANEDYKMQNFSEQTESHTRYMDFEPENKLLKLSSAALDFQFFDNDECEKETTADPTSLPKVDVNFKVVGSEYADTSATSNCDRLLELYSGFPG